MRLEKPNGQQLEQTVDQLNDEQLQGAFNVSKRRTSERWSEYLSEERRFHGLRDEMNRRKLGSAA